MSRKFLPFAIMVLMLVLALGALGVGYGLWFENLDLSGTVNTGTVDVNWSGPTVTEYVHMNGVLEPEDPAKDVADCMASISNNTLSIAVTGAYPSYQCEVEFDIDSTGTVPVHIDTDEANSSGLDWVTFDCGENVSWPIDGLQLHQNEKVICTATIHFDNDDVGNNGIDPATGLPYEFSFNYAIQGHQYNEAASFD